MKAKKAKSVVDVILGEAKAGSYEDMLAIASVIANRANGGQTSWDDVALRTSEFNAYNKPLPSGVDKYRSEAQRAIDQVKKNGPIHNATFYATPKAQGNLPKGLSKVTSTDGHIYFTDPQKRPIYTASGLKKIDYSSLSTPTPQMSFNDAGLPTGLDAPIPNGYDTPTNKDAPEAQSPWGGAKGFSALVPSQNEISPNLTPDDKDYRQDQTDYLASRLSGNWKGKREGAEGFTPEFTSRLAPFVRSLGDTTIHSGFRDADYQAGIISDNMSSYGFGSKQRNRWNSDVQKMGSVDAGKKWRPTFRSAGLTANIGMPGGSNHQKGKAADLTHKTAELGERARARAESFGLQYPMAHEGWHIEPIKDWEKGRINPSEPKIEGYHRGVNPEYGLRPESPPKPSFRNESQTYAAPRGNVERGGNLPAPIDQNTNLYGASPSDYSNYQSSNRSSAMPRGDVAPKPSFRPQVSQPESRGSLSTSMRGAPSRTQPQTDAMPVSMPAPKPAYQPKASDYSNYMMQAPVKTQPEYAPKASDYANYMGSNRTSGLPTGLDAPIPADMPQLPQTTIAGPIGQPMAGIPIPAPRPTKIDRFKQKAGSKLKEHFKPQTVAARMAGGLIGGPMGAMAGPKIAQFINQRGFNGNGLSMPRFGSRQALSPFQSWGNNSSNRMQNAMSGPRGATNTASNGSQATSLGNGQYTYYSPKSGKTSVKGEINMNKSADLRSFFGN